MTLEVLREYNGAFQKVGSFFQHDGAWLFAYSKDYLDISMSQPLSFSLPLRAEPFAHDEYQGFFEGMIPEGIVRTNLAYRLHLSPSDFIGMLSRLGSECVGALQFRNINSALEEPCLSPWDKHDTSRLLSQPEALGPELLQATRLSLAGAQAKFGVYVDSSSDASSLENWFKPYGSAPYRSHFVKPNRRQT